MKVLQLNEWDLAGRRFNGYDLNEGLKHCGHETCQLTFEKKSGNPNVKQIPDSVYLRRDLIALEQRYDLYGSILPYGFVCMKMSEFQRADIVHYHLIHNHMFSLLDFPKMTMSKPSVWTWHDPWAVTGHCVHPKQCEGWKNGCTPCPNLAEYFPLHKDRAGELWRMKREVYRQCDVDIVVSSDFMLKFAKESPLGQCFSRVHKIPFGIELNQFGQKSKEAARNNLGIPLDQFVIACRSEENPYKGTAYIAQMLERLAPDHQITLLTVGSTAPSKKWDKKFHAIHLGWQDDPAMLADFYTASDVFLMPSIAESFGLMAVEAMASGRPVICFEGTALPAVTFAPECGIAVAQGDAGALLESVVRIRENPEEGVSRGERGRALANQHYRFEDYVRRHEELYQEVIARRR